jgi:dCTP deaminase
VTVLSAQTIRRLKPLKPLLPRTQHPESGCSFGLSACGYDIRLDQDVVLRPGEFKLASSIEKFKMPSNVVGIVHDKSTWIRRGLCVFNTVIEPGWCGFLTLELKNVNPETSMPFTSEVYGYREPTIRLVAGTPIAQVIFSFLDEATEQMYEGKYQNQKRGPVAAKDGAGYL